MNNQIEITEKQIGKNWQIFSKVHNLILASDKKVVFRLFPIYTKYTVDDEVIAIMFFKGAFAKDGSVDLGLNIKSEKSPKGLKDAKYMKDRSATYSILINEEDFEKEKIKNLIALTK